MSSFFQSDLLPEKISSSPLVRRFSRSGAILPPPPPAEVPSSPSTQTYPPSPSLRKDHSPSRLSPASPRGSFSHGLLESSSTSLPSHPPSPMQSLRKPQTFSWPPFRPGRDDGPTDFYPPFRAGPDPCEPPPPLSFRPTSGPGMIHDHTPLNSATRGRPAVISSSNAIPIAPRHSSFVHPSGPGRPPSPPVQPFHNSQPFGPSMSPKAPLKPSHAMIPDGGHPPRQPRSEAALQAMPSASLGQGMTPKAYPQYHRHREYFMSCDSIWFLQP